MEPPPTGPRRELPRAALPAALGALALAFALGHTVLRAPLLVPFQGEPALTPLYAFLAPLLRPQALVFASLAALLAVAAPPLVDPARTGRARFAAVLAVASLALPFALFLARDDAQALGTQFVVYRDEEFFHDARRIESPAWFLDRYVEAMPGLSLHGRHFPPGNALLLHLARSALGPGTLPAGLVVLAAFAAGLLAAWRALARLVGEQAARQGALLVLAAPSALDFACTSMDAVFLALAAGAWWCSLRALEPGARPSRALLAGAALLAATFFSFAALPLGAWVLLDALAEARSRPREVARALALVGASYAGCAWALDAATGFPIWRCFAVARESAIELMTRAAGGDPGSFRASISFGNAAAFAIGAGAALAAAGAAGLGALRGPRSPARSAAAATLVSLLAFSAGGIFFLETERIWLFLLPPVAALALARGAWSDRSLRALLATSLAQALAMEVFLHTLW